MNQLPLRLGVAGVVLCGMFTYRYFFVDTDEVIGFNDTLVDVVAASDENFSATGNYLDQYYAGEEIDVAALKSARDQLESNVRKDLQILSEVTVPEDEVCVRFHGDAVRYIENSLKMTESYAEAIDYISVHNPGTEADWEVVDKILETVIASDEICFSAVSHSQQAMAEKYNFDLEY